ncbi:MAG: radical SAM protein [Candidatus Woesearchaeota archaeon]
MSDFVRVDIKTGYLCNNWCRFCVQAHNRDSGNRSTNEVKEAIIEAKKKGASGVVFTGGEFTIRKDSIELVKYAKKLGYEVIQIQTNGRRFSNMKYLKEMFSAGANEFSPALHGHTPQVHDYLTRSPGSWSQTVKGIKNVKKLGGRVVANSVLVKPNYRYLPQMAELFVSLGADQFQFAFMHALGNADVNFESLMARYKLAEPYIKKGLDIASNSGLKVMAEAVPFCIMSGYEEFITELHVPQTMIKEKDFWIDDFDKVRKKGGKLLFEQCKKCKYRLICEGPWKEYPEKMGNFEFVPVKGDVLKSNQELIDKWEGYYC